jgi:hypothetical protein
MWYVIKDMFKAISGIIILTYPSYLSQFLIVYFLTSNTINYYQARK